MAVDKPALIMAVLAAVVMVVVQALVAQEAA